MQQKFKKCRRYNDQGHAHCLTFCCFHRRQFLSRDRTCLWLVDAINHARKKHRFDLWAYVFMPEHVHLLIWPTNRDYSISKILGSIKIPVTRHALAFVRESGQNTRLLEDPQPNKDLHYRFWQRGGGHDRNLIEPTAIWAEIDYIHQNPTRRGLCTHADDWHWSSAADYSGLRSGPLHLDMNSLPRTKKG
jgi:REP-associated tyrosine transposase